MSTNFYFKSIKIECLRGFEKIEVEKFRRINIIAGKNGSGKTTLIESLFWVIDRKNMISPFRVFGWRGLPFNFATASPTLFYNGEEKRTAKVSSSTKDGDLEMELFIENSSQSLNVGVKSTNTESSSRTQSGGNQVAFSLRVLRSGTILQHYKFFESVNGLDVNSVIDTPEFIPSAVILSRKTINSPKDNADRFTTIMQKKKRGNLVEAIKYIAPSVRNLQLLQFADLPVICAEIENENIIPLSFLGDGVISMASIVLAIITCENGAVFLDEFDASFHYSTLPEVWRLIGILAEEHNCQVFAVTHSKENVSYAVKGIRNKKDIQYMRLERRIGKVNVVTYDPDELDASLEEDWEVR